MLRFNLSVRLQALSSADGGRKVLLLVFGQKSFRVVALVKGSEASLQCICDASELADWILDASWLKWKDRDNYQVVFITAHNVLVCHTVDKGQPATIHYHSEISCILYPCSSRVYVKRSCRIISFLTVKKIFRFDCCWWWS